MKTLNKFFWILWIPLAFMRCEETLDMDEPGNLVPMTVDEDSRLPSRMFNGALLHFETMGDISNPIMIFNHGGPGSDYRAMISQKGGENMSRYPELRAGETPGLSQLQDEYFCVFYDQRSSGLSQRYDPDVLELDQFIADLDAIVDWSLDQKEQATGTRDEQVYMFGWSFGGVLVTSYINEHPEKVRDVIFYEAGPITKEGIDYFIDNTPSVFSYIGDDWLEELVLAHDHIIPDTHERADYQQMLGAFRSNPQFHEDINTPLWRFGGLIELADIDCFFCDSFDVTTNLTNFQGRVLFMMGELTRAEYPDYLDLHTVHYPQSEVIFVSGVGHTGVWEKADEVADHIRNFLNQ